MTDWCCRPVIVAYYYSKNHVLARILLIHIDRLCRWVEIRDPMNVETDRFPRDSYNTVTSVRLFSALPCSVSLVATGLVSPYPFAVIRAASIPDPIKLSRTAWAR